MIKNIYKVIQNNPVVQQLLSGKGDISLNNISDEAYVIASAFLASPQDFLIVKPNQYEAQLLYSQLKNMHVDDVLFFPVDESQRIEALAQSPELLAERISTMYELCLNSKHIVITHSAGITRYLPTPSLFKKNLIHLHVGDIVDIHQLKKQLVEMGYAYSSRVDQPFFYGSRGGIIDVYSLQYADPIRIEFFDDEIDSIRFYNKNDQRTISNTSSVTIIPASDILYEDDHIEEAINKIEDIKNKSISKLELFIQDELNNNVAMDMESLRDHDTSFSVYKYYTYISEVSSIYDYLDKPIVLVSPYSQVAENYKMYVTELFSYYQELFEEGRSLQGLDLHFDLYEKLGSRYVVNESFVTKEKQLYFNAREVNQIYTSEENLIRELNSYLRFNRVLLILKNEMHIRNLLDLFDRNQMKYTLISDDDPIYDGLNIMETDFEGGIELVDDHLVVITELELYGKQAVKKTYVKYKNAKVISSFDELNIGDYIVHDAHGIGQYLGIKTLEVQGVHRDYLYISYRGNDVLYVPVEQFKMIRKYTSRDGRPPKVHKLGSSEWQKTKQKVRSKVDDLADELIDLYAKRLQQVGFAFSPDNSLQLEFESEFPYELTPDQETSLQEIKEDMEQPRPMDRLLCGDVGFGKTEVALRAAFKAILDHKQVAFLCPTTILSSQHYRTKERRYKNNQVTYPILNRFSTTKEVKNTIEGLKNGTIDLVVGTHKILNDSVQFKDLGLLIIDEEQRFGVRHKEKIKSMKQSIDVLTLTATPIPRTLQMSLMGIRSLSTIETPPSNRLPVQTYVIEKSQTIIKQVIERELARQGQVFYLYNRTSNIESVAFWITQNIPGAKVGIGHGQMNKNDLDDVMMKFLNKEYNVLVCTTIIETGIDIPNANTLIVEDADHFGLAQLYQLKGRVGRSDRNAYAYLLYRKNHELTEEAKKRLTAIKEFTQLGDGYKIAMRDLSIRGAGDILGGQQAGFIDTVGFDMYMKILQDAINEKQNIKEKEEVPYVNVSVDGYIPQQYVNTDLEKLELYQTVQSASTMSELEAVQDQLVDLYGKLPGSVKSIVDKRLFDILMDSEDIDSYHEDNHSVEIQFTKEASDNIKGEELFGIVMSYDKQVVISYTDLKICLKFKKDKDWLQRAIEILQKKAEYTKA